jgi:hypothetical protein
MRDTVKKVSTRMFAAASLTIKKGDKENNQKFHLME